MKLLWISSIAACVAASAHGQPSMPTKPGSSLPTPAESGMRSAPDSSLKTPQKSGMVVEPPKTGSGADIVKTPSAKVDPEINSATDDIDRKNQKKSQDQRPKSR